MGSMLKKTHASVTIKINGGGPAGTLVAIADGNGNCRGYMEHPEADVPLKPNGKLDVGTLVGSEGLLGVIRDLGEGEPHMGQVPSPFWGNRRGFDRILCRQRADPYHMRIRCPGR